jgi:hypothetical protein
VPLNAESPHSFVQPAYLGEQGLNLIALCATQQLNSVGGILSQRGLQFAALRFATVSAVGIEVDGRYIRIYADDTAEVPCPRVFT